MLLLMLMLMLMLMLLVMLMLMRLLMHSGLAGGCFRKKMEFELALLLDSLDPYGSGKNEIKLH